MNKTTALLLAGTLSVFWSCANPQDSDKKDDTQPPVKATVTKISTIPPSIDDLQITDSVTLTVKATMSDGRTKTVTPTVSSSEDYTYAGGKITALKPGSGTITLTYEGFTVDVPYTNVENYQSLEIEFEQPSQSTPLQAAVGDQYRFKAKATLTDGSTEYVTREEGLKITGNGIFSGTVSVTAEGSTVSEKFNTLRAVDQGQGSITVTYKSQKVEIPYSVSSFVFGTRRFIDDETLSMRAYSYSGYRTDQSPNNQTYPSVEEIAEDLVLLDKANIHFLRLYDTSTHARRTLQAISESGKNFKVQLGVWISGSDAETGTANWLQIDGAVELAQQYPDIIASISVGNECMVDWNNWADAPPEDIKQYIQYLRTHVTVPITTDDNWEPFAEYDIKNEEGETGILATGVKIYRNGDPATPYRTEQVARVVDYLAIHTYPIADTPYSIWDWKQEDIPAGPARGHAMMDLAITVAKKQYQAARDNLDKWGLTDLPLIIGETGWKHRDTSSWPGRSHPVNAKLYYDKMMDWVYGSGRAATQTEGPWVCFYFEAFDEPWKQGDDGWGLWNVNREPTYTLYSQSATDDFVKPAGAPDYTDDDLTYFGK